MLTQMVRFISTQDHYRKARALPLPAVAAAVAVKNSQLPAARHKQYQLPSTLVLTAVLTPAVGRQQQAAHSSSSVMLSASHVSPCNACA